MYCGQEESCQEKEEELEEKEVALLAA